MGPANAQQMMLELVARMTVVVNGSTNIGSVTSVLKLSRVKAPVRSTRL
jgi:hypothetical protein